MERYFFIFTNLIYRKHMKSIVRILSFIYLLFSITFINAQSSKNYSSKIDSILQSKQTIPFNGVILIAKDNKINYQKSVGYKDIDAKIPLDMDTQFEIMSITKQITAVLILQEVEKGNIALNQSIKNYLPNLTQPWANAVTVHHLLNHSHGIDDIEKPLLFEPGTNFKYGNLSNILLGKILEKITEQSYAHLADNLFKKLKMTNTSFYSSLQNPNLANGYFFTDKPNKVNDPISVESYPADGVISTAGDLLIWNNALHKGKLLPKKLYKLMTSESIKSQHDLFGKEPMGYGYNIRIAKHNNITYLGHTGLGNGYSALNIYIPEKKISLIILENQMSEDRDLFYFLENLIKNALLDNL